MAISFNYNPTQQLGKPIKRMTAIHERNRCHSTLVVYIECVANLLLDYKWVDYRILS